MNRNGNVKCLYADYPLVSSTVMHCLCKWKSAQKIQGTLEPAGNGMGTVQQSILRRAVSDSGTPKGPHLRDFKRNMFFLWISGRHWNASGCCPHSQDPRWHGGRANIIYVIQRCCSPSLDEGGGWCSTIRKTSQNSATLHASFRISLVNFWTSLPFTSYAF